MRKRVFCCSLLFDPFRTAVRQLRRSFCYYTNNALFLARHFARKIANFAQVEAIALAQAPRTFTSAGIYSGLEIYGVIIFHNDAALMINPLLARYEAADTGHGINPGVRADMCTRLSDAVCAQTGIIPENTAEK